MHRITENLRAHYGRCFQEHGPSAAGVDWGTPESVTLRYRKMLDVMQVGHSAPSLLDVGCGYGGLLDFAVQLDCPMRYTGIDVCGEMIQAARQRHPEARWEACDLFALEADQLFDYVVCNGVLTQKLATSQLEMESYARDLVRRLYDHARVGLAFNVMTSRANFFAPNLFYMSPVEALAFCLELSPKVRLDHAYPLYEFTAYVYR